MLKKKTMNATQFLTLRNKYIKKDPIQSNHQLQQSKKLLKQPYLRKRVMNQQQWKRYFNQKIPDEKVKSIQKLVKANLEKVSIDQNYQFNRKMKVFKQFRTFLSSRDILEDIKNKQVKQGYNSMSRNLKSSKKLQELERKGSLTERQKSEKFKLKRYKTGFSFIMDEEYAQKIQNKQTRHKSKKQSLRIYVENQKNEQKAHEIKRRRNYFYQEYKQQQFKHMQRKLKRSQQNKEIEEKLWSIKKARNDFRNVQKGRFKLNLQSLKKKQGNAVLGETGNRFIRNNQKYSPFTLNETLRDNDYYYQLDKLLSKQNFYRRTSYKKALTSRQSDLPRMDQLLDNQQWLGKKIKTKKINRLHQFQQVSKQIVSKIQTSLHNIYHKSHDGTGKTHFAQSLPSFKDFNFKKKEEIKKKVRKTEEDENPKNQKQIGMIMDIIIKMQKLSQKKITKEDRILMAGKKKQRLQTFYAIRHLKNELNTIGLSDVESDGEDSFLMQRKLMRQTVQRSNFKELMKARQSQQNGKLPHTTKNQFFSKQMNQKFNIDQIKKVQDIITEAENLKTDPRHKKTLLKDLERELRMYKTHLDSECSSKQLTYFLLMDPSQMNKQNK